MTARLSWVELEPGHVVAASPRRGRYVAREREPGRWMLSGPRDRNPWTCGSLSEVQDAAEFVDARR